MTITKQNWELTLRELVKDLAPEKGLTVNKSKREKVELRLRGKDKKCQSVILPFDWTEKQSGDAYTRVRNIYRFIAERTNGRLAMIGFMAVILSLIHISEPTRPY